MSTTPPPPPTPSSRKWHTSLLDELGLRTLYNSTSDAKLLCILRFTRLFSYGIVALILVLHLTVLHISKTRIGLFMTLTLIGDTIISFFLTLFADAIGRRKVLAVGSVMMASSGIAFALSGNFWVLLCAAVLGVISPSGNEIGPFRAIEESTLAQLTSASERGDMYAWYTLLGQAGAACGLAVTGLAVQYMTEVVHWEVSRVYRMVFWAYAILGVLMLLFTLPLSPATEAQPKTQNLAGVQSVNEDPETAPLLQDSSVTPEPKVTNSRWRSALPQISSESRSIVLSLCLLFGLDAFASGLSALSWVTYYFQNKFSLPPAELGSIFFTTTMIAAFSTLIAASIAKRFGNVKTMVFTHLPSSCFLALISFPSTLPLALTFLVLRSCTSSMDTAPRAAFTSMVLLPNERTSVLGLINVVKTLTQCLSPLVTGFLAERGLIGWSFVLAGACKVVYDLGILVMFAGHKPRDEER